MKSRVPQVAIAIVPIPYRHGSAEHASPGVRAMKLLALLLLLALPLSAESRTHKLFRWSVAAFSAGNALDAASSFGRAEMNPVLGDRFGARALGVKVGIASAVILVERIAIRKHPELEKPLSIGNFVAGTALSGVAARNWRMPR